MNEILIDSRNVEKYLKNCPSDKIKLVICYLFLKTFQFHEVSEYLQGNVT